MNLPESIKTIPSLSEFKLKEKGSQFLAFSKPVNDETEVQNYLAELRKKFYDATHHCYSYKLMGGSFKYSDDGEPNGTAGIRIYNAQNHFEVTNIITVVVRYFGGVKLGVGPLGKAYYETAMGSLSASTINELKLYRQLEVYFDFALSKSVHHFVNKHKAIIKQNLFNSKPGMIIMIRTLSADPFIAELMAATQNQCTISRLEGFEYLNV